MAKKAGVARIILLTAILAQLTDGVSASAQRGSPTAGAKCRTYATADTMSLSSPTGVTVRATKTCNYNTAAKELRCTIKYTDNRSVSYTSVMTVKFATVADFVGDAPRVSLFGSIETHPMTSLTSVDTTGVRSTTTATHSYDAQRRPTRMAMRSDPGGLTSLTFTAWDSFGRPTAAMTDSGRSEYVYNDAERTATMTNVNAGTVVTQSFDENGLQVRQTSRSAAGNETSTWTIQSTAQVCR